MVYAVVTRKNTTVLSHGEEFLVLSFSRLFWVFFFEDFLQKIYGISLKYCFSNVGRRKPNVGDVRVVFSAKGK